MAHDPEREAFLTEYIRAAYDGTGAEDDPELRALVAGTFGFQVAWVNHVTRTDVGAPLRERVKALSEKVAEKRDAALRRYWRS